MAPGRVTLRASGILSSPTLRPVHWNAMDRRQFVKNVALSGSYLLLLEQELARAVTRPPADIDAAALASNLEFFSPLERIALAKLCDSIVPGAAKLGSVNYIETLLTAFDSDPPKIYAG